MRVDKTLIFAIALPFLLVANSAAQASGHRHSTFRAGAVYKFRHNISDAYWLRSYQDTPEACRDHCLSHPQCRAWEYWTKNDISQILQRKCFMLKRAGPVAPLLPGHHGFSGEIIGP